MNMNFVASVTADGLVDWFDGKVNEVNGVVTGVCIVVGIIVAILIIAKNPTVGRAIIGVAVGAFIAGLPWIIPAVGELFRGDVEAAPAPGTVNEQIVAEPDKADLTVSAG